MLQDIAYGGTLGTSLFRNVSTPYANAKILLTWTMQSISASPYLPQQYGYKDCKPSSGYKY